MDELFKEFFGDAEENKKDIEVNATEVSEAPQAASEPEAAPEAQAAPAAAEVPEAVQEPPHFEDVYASIMAEREEKTEPTVQETPVPPVSEPAYTAPQPQQPPQQFTPPYGGTYTVPPQNAQGNRTAYYQPPTQNNTYTAPPVYHQPQPAYTAPAAPTEAAPKKKRKAPWIIALIVVLCIAVAGAGIGSAVKSYQNGGSEEKTTASNPLEDFLKDKDDGDTTNDSDDAQASVKSSDEAAKKDNKGNLTVAGVASENKDSCVGITVYTEQQSYDYFNFYGSQQQQGGGKVASGEGSGVIMSEADGKTYIMTCAHVIEGGSSFTVTLDNDKEYEARMVGLDSQTDIGVLVINAKGLKVAEFGDSKDIEVGEDCVAIGCPGGLQFKNSVTKGIVSALDVPVSSSIGYSNECIQVDAAINPGNSGGALFNMQGQVIGINSSKIASTDYEGMGFAVPSNTAVETANSLIKNGYVKGRAKLGITYNTLNNYSSANAILRALEEKGFKEANGAMVIQEISSDSDLNGKAQQYDMIVAVNGETMTSVDVLTSVLSKSKPGDTVKLTLARINNNNQIDIMNVTCKLIEAKE